MHGWTEKHIQAWATRVDTQIHILFITRKFPPAKGGMEIAAYELSKHLSQVAKVTLIKQSKSNKWLPFAVPYLLLSSLRVLLSSKVDVVYIYDGLLAPIGCLLKVFRKPVFVTVNGLDITYRNKLYQFIVPKCISRLDRIVCISQATMKECVRRGVPPERLTVIPVGVSDAFYMGLDDTEKNALRAALSLRFNLNMHDKVVLLSVGRLIERKGFHWFVQDVVPRIIEQNPNCIYLLVGEGANRHTIEEAIKTKGPDNHVFMLGQVDDEVRKCLYNIADIYVMPNIPVEGDLEGFGIVALEASSSCLPVVASRLEGIEDAVKGQENGFLIEPKQAKDFAETILILAKDRLARQGFGKKAREFTISHYSWQKIADRYLHEVRTATGK